MRSGRLPTKLLCVNRYNTCTGHVILITETGAYRVKSGIVSIATNMSTHLHVKPNISGATTRVVLVHRL